MVNPLTICPSSWLKIGGTAVASTVKMTFSFFVWKTAPLSERRPPARSHFVPTS
ncbi:hypothetical protein D3C83_98550 [compost metagenome]